MRRMHGVAQANGQRTVGIEDMIAQVSSGLDLCTASIELEPGWQYWRLAGCGCMPQTLFGRTAALPLYSGPVRM